MRKKVNRKSQGSKESRESESDQLSSIQTPLKSQNDQGEQESPEKSIEKIPFTPSQEVEKLNKSIDQKQDYGTINEVKEQDEIAADEDSVIPPAKLTIDEAYELIGGFGSIQKVAMALCFLGVKCMSAMFFQSTAYLEMYPYYKCEFETGVYTYSTEENTLQDEFCAVNDNGDSIYNCQVDWDAPESLHNFVEQFDLNCKDSIYIGMFGAAFLFGIVLGSYFVSPLGDVYGRKSSFLYGMLQHVVVVILAILVRNVWVAYVLLVVAGTLLPAREYTGYLYSVELQPLSVQPALCVMLVASDSLAFLFVSIFYAYISDTWVWLNVFAIGALCIISFFTWWLLPESPRWLVSVKRYEEAKQALIQLARFNNASEQTLETLINLEFKVDAKQDLEEMSKKKIDDLLPMPVLKSNYYGSMVLWTSNCAIFYILFFYIKYYPGNTYINGMISACTDMVAYILLICALPWVNFKNIFTTCFASILIASTLYLCGKDNQAIVYTSLSLNRMGTAASYNLGFLTVTRMFPIDYNSTVVGYMCFVGHIFACFSALFAEFPEPWPFLFNVIYALAAILAVPVLTQIQQGLSLEEYKNQVNTTPDHIEISNSESKHEKQSTQQDNQQNI